mmetsp:Transcript_13877/g.60617  ORF Transcript_13877/g.60617 Transcript_13877/m.60617 type:complete len:299 (+) Transcript_13877:66-962(+)
MTSPSRSHPAGASASSRPTTRQRPAATAVATPPTASSACTGTSCAARSPPRPLSSRAGSSRGPPGRISTRTWCRSETTTTATTATATTTTRTFRARRDCCSADRRTAAASSPPSWTRAARSGCEPTPSGDARCSCATLEGACGSSVRPRAATHRTSGTAGGAIIPDTSSPSIHSPAISTRRAPSAATPAPAPRAACRSYPRTWSPARAPRTRCSRFAAPRSNPTRRRERRRDGSNPPMPRASSRLGTTRSGTKGWTPRPIVSRGVSSPRCTTSRRTTGARANARSGCCSAAAWTRRRC